MYTNVRNNFSSVVYVTVDNIKGYYTHNTFFHFESILWRLDTIWMNGLDDILCRLIWSMCRGLLKTVQILEMDSAAYGAVQYKEPFKSFHNIGVETLIRASFFGNVVMIVQKVT